jgi:outer membrane protein OmpA-like peptidoglycan-associated protein
MKKLLIFLLLSFSFFSIYSETFRYKYDEGQKQRIEYNSKGFIFFNGKLEHEYIQNYKIISSILKITNNIAQIQEENYYYYNVTSKNSNSQIAQVKEITSVKYSKDQLGKMIVKNSDLLPVLRNVPYFPEEDIKPGYKWNSSGFEVQDYFIDKSLSISPIDVYYEFVGYENLNGKKVEKINYEFTVDITNTEKLTFDKRIVRLLGNSKTVLYFDNETGIRLKEEYERHYFMVIGPDFKVAEFIDEGTRIFHPVELLNKDKMIDEINKGLKDKKIENAKIEKDDKGLKLSLENIQFEPDSAVLTEYEKVRIDKIAEILNLYKGKSLMFVGHTTDRGTEEGRTKLSLERAKSVTEYLSKKGAIDPSRASYIGKGGKEPVANNSTEEGMKKNRRVEIYILEE